MYIEYLLDENIFSAIAVYRPSPSKIENIKDINIVTNAYLYLKLILDIGYEIKKTNAVLWNRLAMKTVKINFFQFFSTI